MSDTNATAYRLDFTPEDVRRVEIYRRRTDTSVLTIMFTDIEGFTAIAEARGDRAANELRRRHDEMLGPIIEAGGVGQIVKHIGDAVMAVFSEPSAAVDRALAIQARLREFNREQADPAGLRVRIGLHMGQVTTENEVDLDVFGRHVNRASRVVSLAGGGQIFLTYPVFDSARGWLAGGEPAAAWRLHGDYYVKGIAEPIAIYEVYDPAQAAPRPPRGARRKRSRAIPLALAGGFVAAAALTAWLAMRFGPGSAGPTAAPAAATRPAAPGTARSVTLINMPDARVYLDHKTRLVVDGERGQRVRKALTKIPVGDHLLHWTFSHCSRYYARISVTEGDNVIEPFFRPHALPGLSRHVKFTGPGPHRQEDSRSARYVTYDADNQPHEHQADLALSIEMAPDNVDPTQRKFTYNWRILVDGRQIGADSLTVTNPAARKDPVRDKKVVFQDDFHYFEIHYYIIGSATEMEIRCGYGMSAGK